MKEANLAGEADKPSRVFTLIPGTEVLEAVKTPEGAQALYEDICRALGIAPKQQPARGEASGEQNAYEEACRLLGYAAVPLPERRSRRLVIELVAEITKNGTTPMDRVLANVRRSSRSLL
jgi:hypothetical protein